jgi:hypothetical protein
VCLRRTRYDDPAGGSDVPIDPRVDEARDLLTMGVAELACRSAIDSARRVELSTLPTPGAERSSLSSEHTEKKEDRAKRSVHRLSLNSLFHVLIFSASVFCGCLW